MFSLDQKLTLESFHRHLLVVFLTELTFLNKMSIFPEIEIIAESVESKKKIFRQSWS